MSDSAILFKYDPQLPDAHTDKRKTMSEEMNKRNATKTTELEGAVSKETKQTSKMARHYKGACTMQGYSLQKLFQNGSEMWKT